MGNIYLRVIKLGIAVRFGIWLTQELKQLRYKYNLLYASSIFNVHYQLRKLSTQQKAYFMMNYSKLLLSVELLVVSGMLSDLYILA